MNLEQLKEEIIPAALSALENARRDAETETSSAIRKAVIACCGETFTVLDQNTRKIDPRTKEPSKFAKLARAGHAVFWIIRDASGEWFLVVDGKLAKKQYITNDGQLIEGAFF